MAPLAAAAARTDASEIISEVDLNSYGAYGRTYQELIDDVIQVGGDYKVLHSKLTRIFDGDGSECSVRRKVEELKLRVWKVSKGVAGVKVDVNGTAMDWTEFVKFAFDITPRRLNQLLDIEDAPLPKPKPKEKKSWVKMEKADYDKAMKEQWDKGVMSAGLKPEEVVAKIEDAETVALDRAYDQGVADTQAKYMLKLAEAKHAAQESEDEPAAEPEPADFDIDDPYFHFHQFRDEPQTMASELAAMLLEFRMDEQQTLTLLELVKKELRAQRKVLAA
jgi:hypothetical protein